MTTDATQIGPLCFETALDWQGELEIMWENKYDEVESRWITKAQAVELIDFLSEKFQVP